jgi:hypothetical protein
MEADRTVNSPLVVPNGDRIWSGRLQRPAEIILAEDKPEILILCGITEVLSVSKKSTQIKDNTYCRCLKCEDNSISAPKTRD